MLDDYDKVRLDSTGGKPVLSIDGRCLPGINPDGRCSLEINAEVAHKLARIGLQTLDRLGLVISELEPRPPYVIVVRLPYSDIDAVDQCVEEWRVPDAYHLALAIDGDKSLALQILKACQDEIVATTSFDQHEVRLDPLPELQFSIDNIPLISSVQAAIHDLRGAMLVHESDSVIYDLQYWEHIGFSEDELDACEGEITMLREINSSRGMCEDMADDLETYIKTNPEVDWEAHIGLPKLRRWVAGLPVIEGQPTAP